MDNPIYLTVMAGVLVFVLSQFILKLVLEPIASFKESLGSLSAFGLLYHRIIVNGTANSELQHDLRIIISTLLSKKEAIPFYSIVGFIMGFPTGKKLLEGCRKLNYVGTEMNKDTAMQPGSPNCIEITEHLYAAGELLKARVNYSE